MTRINVIDPIALTDQHLMAEYRELPRVIPLARAAIGRNVKAPKNYTMGTGHVTFFYDKTPWLVQRHAAIVTELLKRGYDLKRTDALVPVEGYAPSDWSPSPADVDVNMERLRLRLREKNGTFYTHYKQSVGMDFYSA